MTAASHATLWNQGTEAFRPEAGEKLTAPVRNDPTGEWNLNSVLVGNSAVMQNLKELVQKIGPSTATVIIKGETGTGKELVAEAVHRLSRRSSKPLVKLNCAAVAETLVEDHIFGHEPGSYTGADSRKVGVFEFANGGTVFLDEVSELSFRFQIDLLRVLEEKEFFRIGGTQVVKTDFRCIAATSKNLKTLVEKGIFRRDLLYRLHVLTITLPPLRDRPEDIPLLVDHFLRMYRSQLKKSTPRVTCSAIDFLLRHTWPGNVRELKNAVERALVIGCGSTIQPSDFHLLVSQEQSRPPRTLAELSRAHILKTLEATDWNVARTARLLGITRSTLYYQLRRYGVKARPQPRRQRRTYEHFDGQEAAYSPMD
jgi:DNA-binding NtrC family response regulator